MAERYGYWEMISKICVYTRNLEREISRVHRKCDIISGNPLEREREREREREVG